MKTIYVVLLLLLTSAAGAMAQTPHFDVALGYTFTHANAPPGGCGCFSMNGGTGSLAWYLNPRFAMVGEIGAMHASDVPASGQDLTLTTFLVGPRFALVRKSSVGEMKWHTITPFTQVLLGGAHASGSLSGASSGSSNGFAFAVGGGANLGLNRRFSWRLFQTEYLLTTAPNTVNDHQNSFRLTSGIVIRF